MPAQQCWNAWRPNRGIRKLTYPGTSGLLETTPASNNDYRVNYLINWTGSPSVLVNCVLIQVSAISS